MSIDKTDLFVYAHWCGMPEPVLIGILSAHQGKGRRSYSFEYDAHWLKGKDLFLLDPEIGLFPGPQFPGKRENFGIFLDSMPDTWGRTLMARRSLQIAKSEGRVAPSLHDVDYLLGVADKCRMGAMRFKLDRDGPFLEDDSNTPVPPWTSVGDLQHIADLVESGNNPRELNKWLALLMAPGSSLGGARPKANVMDNSGQLWIAKFPSGNDTIDKAKWEFLAYKLAIASGIKMSESRIEKVSGNYCTFFTKRFDRIREERVHFASAMTMTGNSEEILRNKRVSYLDLSMFIQDHGGNINEDLAELWRRIVFNIAVSNTDDHLRNHGFVIENGSWRLSPAYDINPSIDKEELALNIDDSSGALEFDLVLSVAGYFRLTIKEARAIQFHVLQVVSNWQKTAKQIAIPRSEIEKMQRAFRI